MSMEKIGKNIAQRLGNGSRDIKAAFMIRIPRISGGLETNPRSENNGREYEQEIHYRERPSRGRQNNHLPDTAAEPEPQCLA